MSVEFYKIDSSWALDSFLQEMLDMEEGKLLEATLKKDEFERGLSAGRLDIIAQIWRRKRGQSWNDKKEGV